MDIYPSILETSIKDFETQLTQVAPYFSHFQIDIADGIFVPNKTVQIEEIVPVVSSQKIVGRDKTFEFHLMVVDFEKQIEKLAQLEKFVDVNCILIHLHVLNTKYEILNTKYLWGLVLNPEDSVVDNWQLITEFPIIQIMTIHPGFQGSPFLPETLNKIDQLRELGYTGKILLDGGINDKTAPTIMNRRHLPDIICPGSYFKKDVKKRLEILQEIVRTTNK